MRAQEDAERAARNAARNDFTKNRNNNYYDNSMHDKEIDRRIGRFIGNQAEYSVTEEVNHYKEEIFAELKELREEHTAEIEVNFKKMKPKPITPFKTSNYRELYGDDGIYGPGYNAGYYDPYYGTPSRVSTRRSPTRELRK